MISSAELTSFKGHYVITSRISKNLPLRAQQLLHFRIQPSPTVDKTLTVILKVSLEKKIKNILESLDLLCNISVILVLHNSCVERAQRISRFVDSGIMAKVARFCLLLLWMVCIYSEVDLLKLSRNQEKNQNCFKFKFSRKVHPNAK